jgi:hypothetical protein
MRIFFIVVVLLSTAVARADELVLVDAASTAGIYVDPHDAAVVTVAGNLLADDFERVTTHRSAVQTDPTKLGSTAILIGTIGQSAAIDQLIAANKLDVTNIKGQWESFLWQTVDEPLPGVHHALVIAGSDRRGTAYGAMELSAQIGVSPWYYWADVPTAKRDQISVPTGRTIATSPKVKYRGIFLNDEDFGLRPWSTKTLDPEAGAMGPKTYAKIFELMLRLRLNYIWPAMHPGGTEFSMYPGNAETADQWAIVTGSSHCEPMLRNNVYWPKSSGQWRYDVNRDNIFNYWKEAAEKRGDFEAVWTLGIRGIHDTGMSGPKALPDRIKMVEGIFADQKSLIDQYVTKKYGPPAQCFVPYKEVLPLYDAGMKVPEDVSLVWPDDNYGYVRRLGTTAERARPGGSGVYYHLSYWGGPHSYLWVETTSPGLMWQELRKTYDNDSKTIWIVNVGDLKPAEVCIDFWSKLAWDPQAWGPDAQEKFLAGFDADNFGSAAAKVAELQANYYRLASVRKPESIDYKWVDSLSAADEADMIKQYNGLLEEERAVAAAIPADRTDTYFETVGYAVRALCASGLLYTGDEETAQKWKRYIDDQTADYNNKIAGGKWHLMMSETMEGLSWPAIVGGKQKPATRTAKPADQSTVVIDAAAFTRHTAATAADWKPVTGLGWSGRALSLLPATPASQWDMDHLHNGPSVEYDFKLATAGNGNIKLHALPTMRLTLGGKLRVAVAVDNNPPQAIDIPGGESDNELGKVRSAGVLANRVTMTIPTGFLAAGSHTLKVYALDPGVVLDQIELPASAR